MKRLLTGFALAGLMVPAVLLLPSLGMLLVSVAVAEACLVELVPMLRRLVPQAPFAALFLLVPIAVASIVWFPDRWSAHQAPVLGTVGLVAAVVLLLAARTPLEQGPQALGLLGFGVVYLSLPAVAVYRLHRVDPWLLFALVALVVLQDTAAFYIGRTLGRRKLSPRVSPQKTWEGSIAGFGTALVVIALYAALRGGGVTPLWLALGASAAAAGQLGDLAESMIKRAAGIKDSGTLLPGHGGVLDRLDALLLAAPVLYVGVVAARLTA